MPPGPKPRPAEDRFWEKVLPEPNSGCWFWIGALDTKGYGIFWPVTGEGKYLDRAHRFSYELLIGEIPVGLDLDHLCRMRMCVRPQHLEPTTRQINVLRGVGPAAENARRETCIHGHDFTDENTYYRKDRVGRLCRRCDADRHARAHGEVVHAAS